MATKETETTESQLIADDRVYVAVGKDVEKSKLTLLWALQNFPGKKIGILHVHQAAKMIPTIGGNVPVSRLEEEELKEFQKLGRKITSKMLDDYLPRTRVHAEKLYIEKDDTGKGIVELVYLHTIKKLVMGAAADKHYSEGMTGIRSRKAKYVERRVPLSCQIYFICKGRLIHTREDDFSFSSTEESSDLDSDETEGSEFDLESREVPQQKEDSHLHTLDASVDSINQLYNQLERAMEETEKFKREAYEESLSRGEAEKTAIKAIRRAKLLEGLYKEELRHRKQTEEALTEEKENHQRTAEELNKVHSVAMNRRKLQEKQAADFDNKIKELGDKIFSAVEECKKYKEERDELAKELSKKQAEDVSIMHMHRFLSVFSLSEIQEATCNFDPSLKIGEGGYGSIYKGFLHHTPVAIKMLNPDSMQGPAEFKQEVDVLTKLRHPNLVTLIGACSEVCALIYEYLPNGSLEDRLRCKDNTPPLSWQARIRIATELCSVLVFLHSSNSHRIVHGDLKPGNILLDASLACRLSDFGICRALSIHENVNNLTQCHRTDPKGTFHYLDPHFLATGELSPKSDTYSFGIILLQLLTGKPAFGLAKEIGDAINKGNLSSLLDPSAGDWPFVKAKQLAHLALRCCKMNRSSRPDLASEVWRVLEPMRASCGASLSFQFGSRELQQPPSYFICPVLQEVMQDPQVAADGFTYEAEALRGWLDSGHNTSPMTNLELENFDLIPNRSLRSAIQEWLQQP